MSMDSALAAHGNELRKASQDDSASAVPQRLVALLPLIAACTKAILRVIITARRALMDLPAHSMPAAILTV